MENCVRSTICDATWGKNKTLANCNPATVIDDTDYGFICLNIILSAIISLGGILGNSAIITVFFRRKALQNVNNVFLVQLALVDFTKAAFILTVKVATNSMLLNTEEKNNGKPCYDLGFYCNVSGFVSTVTFVHSALLLAAIAVVRYVKMVRSSLFDVIFAKRNMICYCCILASLSTVLAFLPIFNVGKYKYSPYHGVCFTNWAEENEIFRITFYVYTIGICYVAILFSYVKIYLKLREHKKNTQGSFDVARTISQDISKTQDVCGDKQFEKRNPRNSEVESYKGKPKRQVEISGDSLSVHYSNESARDVTDVEIKENISVVVNPRYNDNQDNIAPNCIGKVKMRFQGKASRDPPSMRQSGTFRNELRVTKVMFAIVVAYSMCWLPAFATNVIMLSTQEPGSGNSRVVSPLVLFYIITLVDLKVLINPIIYGILNSQFRKEIKKLFCTFSLRE